MVAQFTAKTTNSEKAIYFLSLMPCSINKLKPHMLFTCKNFMSFDFTWKKNCSRKWWGPNASLPPFSLSLRPWKVQYLIFQLLEKDSVWKQTYYQVILKAYFWWRNALRFEKVILHTSNQHLDVRINRLLK